MPTPAVENESKKGQFTQASTGCGALQTDGVSFQCGHQRPIIVSDDKVLPVLEQHQVCNLSTRSVCGPVQQSSS